MCCVHRLDAMMQKAREERREREGEGVGHARSLPVQDSEPDAQPEEEQEELHEEGGVAQTPPAQDSEHEDGDEQNGVHQDVGLTAPTGDSQVFLSKAERRHPTVQSVEQ